MRRVLTWLAVVPLLALAAPAPAQDEAPAAGAALAQVPAQAPVVFYVRGVERTKDRLLKLVETAAPDLAEVVRTKVEDAFKEGLEGRKLKGLPKDGAIFVVSTELPKPGEGEPGAAVIVQVSDYKAFRDAALKDDERKALKKSDAGYETTTVNDKEVYFIDRQGYAVVASSEAAAKLFTSKNFKGLDSKVKGATAQRLLGSDLALYVDMAAVNEQYGDQIKGAQQMFVLVLDQVAQAGGAAMKIDKGQLEMIKTVAGNMFQIVGDSRLFLMTADFLPQGLALHKEVQVAADSESNAFFKNAKPGPVENLGGLAAGRLAYMGMRLDSELTRFVLRYQFGAVGGQGEARKAMADLLKAGPQTLIGESSMPPEGVQVTTYADPDKAVAASLKLYGAFKDGQTFASLPIKGKPTVKADAEEYKGFKLNHVSMTFDLEKMGENLPQGGADLAAAMKKAFGGDTMKIWYGTDGKVVVQVTARDWERARKLLDQYLDGRNTAGQQKAFQTTLQNLPEQTSMVTLMDLPQYLQAVTEMIGPMFKGQGLPINIPTLKAPKGRYSYLGLAVTMQPGKVSADVWVPASAVQEIRKMVGPALNPAGVQ